MYYLHVYGIFNVVDKERSIERRGSYMKNRKAIIVIGAIGLLLALMIAAVGVIAVKGLDISTGRYLETKNGTSMIVIDNSPIQMSSRTNKTKAEFFDKLDVGDEILIIHDGIAETYPGKTGVFAVFKLHEGTGEDIPQRVVDELTGLGWEPQISNKE